MASHSSSDHVYRVKSSASSVRSEHAYPSGHFGHLTEGEEEAFQKFKVYLQEKGYYRPGPPPSHNDPTLLRFLRARRWVVEDGFKQFKDTEDWRAANHLNQLYDTIDLGAYEAARRLYPQWTGRRDKRGIPLYVFEIRYLDNQTIHTYEKSANADSYTKSLGDKKTSPTLLRLMALYENLTRFAQPLCTELTDRDNARTPITMSTNIVDVSGVGLRQFWNLKAHMQAASTLATAHYPETLDRVYIVGAPFFFATVWGWIKRWFDPITVSKIFVLSASEVMPTLESFIDPKNIPTQYGGQLEFKFGDRPNLDPAIRELATWEKGLDSFPEGPMYWLPIDDGKRLELVAVGRHKGQDRRQRVCTIPRAFPDEPLLQLAPEVVANGQPVRSKEAAPGATKTDITAPGATKTPPDAKVQPEPRVADDTSKTPAVSATEPPQPDVQGVQNLSIVADGAGEPTAEESAISEKPAALDPPPETEAVSA